MISEDIQLVSEARHGSSRAAEALVDRFYAPVYAFLRRLAGNDTDAADLTQKTFARLWKALERFAGRSTVQAWLHGIAHHVYLDWVRANHRTTSMPEEWWLDCPDPCIAPDAQVARADLAATVYRTVDRLEPELRDTVHLHYYQGLTIEETAAALDIATSTVKYRLRSALARLQSKLADRPQPRLSVDTLRPL